MISCSPFFVSLLHNGAQPRCALLLVTQVLTSTEILAHRAETNRTRSLMWTIRTPDPLNYPLCVLDKLSHLWHYLNPRRRWPDFL